MDIDKLFKVWSFQHLCELFISYSLWQTPKLPIGGNKRRMPEAPTPEMLKRMKVEAPISSTFTQPSPPPQTNGSSSGGKSRQATVRDEEDEEMDVELVGEFAPGNDADYFAEEDGEGRFFGGGLTDEQKTILNIFDKAGGEGTLDEVSDFFCRLACLTVLSIDIDSMKNFQ